MNLDEMSALEIVEMNREDAGIPEAIRPHLPEIAQVAEWGAQSLFDGGRISIWELARADSESWMRQNARLRSEFLRKR